jgi:excinuclease UvrABC nuclease subunit
MECFDISNVSSNHIVASMVRFTNGKPDNQNQQPQQGVANGAGGINP